MWRLPRSKLYVGQFFRSTCILRLTHMDAAYSGTFGTIFVVGMFSTVYGVASLIKVVNIFKRLLDRTNAIVLRGSRHSKASILLESYRCSKQACTSAFRAQTSQPEEASFTGSSFCNSMFSDRREQDFPSLGSAFHQTMITLNRIRSYVSAFSPICIVSHDILRWVLP
jgi:hypothetical protein